MARKLTKLELLKIRDDSYRPPPEARCATCRSFSNFSSRCQAVEIRGRIIQREVDPAGVCDLWVRKSQ